MDAGIAMSSEMVAQPVREHSSAVVAQPTAP